MKIVHISPAVFGPGKRGGGERYVSELFHAQYALGANVCAIEMPSPLSAEVLETPQSSPKAISLPAIISTLRAADIVHVHQLNTSSFDVAAILRPLSGYRMVLTDHGGGNLTPGRLLGKARLPLVDGAAYVSNWSRSDVDPAGKVRQFAVVYGGGDHVAPAPHWAPKDEYDFGFVGRLLPHKGAHVVIQALPENATLLIAGERRDSEYFSYLKDLASGKSVDFRHDVKDEDIAALYRSIKRLLVPSVKAFREKTYSRPELLGLVALESLFHGTPVIGSDVGGLGEMLSSMEQRVVRPGDVPAWRAAMSDALGHSEPELPSEHLTWEAVARKCLALYASLLPNSHKV